MTTAREIDMLMYIAGEYGAFINEAAAMWRHRPEVLAGIMMRETQGGLADALDVKGPQGRGDCEKKRLPDGTEVKIFHGHGLMQVDDRSFPSYCASGRWKDARDN